MSAVEILESGKLYTRDELRKLLSGHLCACTGYENILNAVEKDHETPAGGLKPERHANRPRGGRREPAALFVLAALPARGESFARLWGKTMRAIRKEERDRDRTGYHPAVAGV